MKKNLIKKSILSLSILSSAHLLAHEVSPKKELLQDIKAQTKKCAVQIVSVAYDTQNENVLGYKSVCNTLKILSAQEAQIFIDGKWLTAVISESAESDGGDLDDLTITNSKGQTLATKTNIAAYDSVLVAMAGDTDFKKIKVK
ncbi:MAG: hypothetical protein ACXVCE_02600 [Bacteriovorax sp.]